uniref:Uncharacterized protein n=1 Tax=Eucampia antarctica TaxID=49252 RepID=A0A7S2RXG4_9STRA
MNPITPDEVEAIPPSYKESHHPSQTRKGYRVFLSRYFLDFKALSFEEKFKVLVRHRILAESDDISIDSICTPRSPHAYEIIKAAATLWRIMPNEMRDSWNFFRGFSIHYLFLVDF